MQIAQPREQKHIQFPEQLVKKQLTLQASAFCGRKLATKAVRPIAVLMSTFIMQSFTKDGLRPLRGYLRAEVLA